MAILVVTILAIPVAFSGCGKAVDDVPADDTIVESQTDINVSDGIEDGLADMGITVETETDVPDVIEEEEDILDESEVNYDTLYATSNINVYSEPSEESDIVCTYETDSRVHTSGLYHKAQFYRVTYTDSTGQEVYGYVRVVDLTPFKGGYSEENNVTPESTQGSSDKPLAGLPLLPPSTMSPEEEQALYEKYGFSGAGSNYDPSQDEEYVLGQSGESTLPPANIQ